MKKLVSEMKVGDVFKINGDNFQVMSIEPASTSDSVKVWYQSQKTGRYYVRVIWKNDSLNVVDYLSN